MPQPILILSTCESRDQGERIAHALVAERLAACVNIVPGITSVYRWMGAVETASEHLLIIKTTEEKSAAVEERIVLLHSYDTPELLRIPIEGGSQKYFAWLISAIGEAGPEHVA
jgi:periplasmic divalent cation tolerance protein